jgi:16S rRNA (cytidine1402-2'-O)-methyltransferase
VPRQASKRRELAERLARAAEPVVLFELPERIAATLAELAAELPHRRALVCRELTKLHEEIARGTLAELAARDPTVRGEVTLVIDASEAEHETSDEPPSDEELLELLSSGESPRAIVEALGTRSGGARRELYRRVTELARSRES